MTTRHHNERSTRPTSRAEVGIQPRAPTDVEVQPLPSATGHEFERRSVAERRFHETHAAWIEALRASGRGGAAELARLGLAQQAYEEAKTALDRLTDEATVTDRRLEKLREERRATERRAAAIAAQSVAWSRVREPKPSRGGLRGLIDRLTGRR